MIRKSTFIITISILFIIFISTILILIYHYEDKNIDAAIPTVVETNEDVEGLLPEISI